MYTRLDVANILKKSGAMMMSKERTWGLKNGAESHLYFNVASAYSQPHYFNPLCDALWDEINNRNMCCENILGASGYGGLPIAANISAKHSLGMVFYRESSKDHGVPGKLTKEVFSADEKISMVDGVVTSGGSFTEMATALRDAGAAVDAAYVFVDRSEEEFVFSSAKNKERFERAKEEWRKMKIPLYSLYKPRILI